MILKTKHKLAIARAIQSPILLFRKIAGLGPEATVRRSGLSWSLDLREGIDFAIFLTGKFERQTVDAIARCLSSGDTAIDIGANIGAHTLQMGSRVGRQGRVYAVEPTKYAYEKLRKNVAINPAIADSISVDQIMMVDQARSRVEDMLYSSWPLDSCRREHEKHGGSLKSTEGATALRLDDYVRSKSIDRVKLIKLDVDGYEIEVLRGGAALLQRDKPIIVMELAPYTFQERGQRFEDLIEILRHSGYRLRHESTGDEIATDARVLQSIIPDGGSINVIAQ